MKNELLELVPRIRRFAYSLTGSMPDADDLMQNTVERVLTHGVPEGVELIKWVFRVCRNIWIDDYRARKVRWEAAQDPELQDRELVDGERAMVGEIELEQVNRAMATLPNDQRTILSLVALQGMSYKEVASTLEVPPGTVMSRLARARAALANKLKVTATRTQP